MSPTARVPMKSKQRATAIGWCGAACVLLAAPSGRGDSLTVYAAASLTKAFNEIADSLKARHPGMHIDLDYAGSQALALQIQQRVTADVFASADERWMKVVGDSGWLAGLPQVFAHNRLVVIIPRANPARIGALRDLSRPGVKLVLADDAVPAGHYAREAFVRLGGIAGYPAGYARDVLRNLVSNEDNVKAVLAKVQLGEADAGVVYVSDVGSPVAAQVTRIEIPDPANVTADYPIAVLRHAAHPTMAQAFISLVLSPVGQEILARNNFIPLRMVH